ncbi:glycine N-acyltransferase-like protein 3, partial [Protobothrops mucrosquamatus]|uniref:glycine N-acyltransferase-like protein 3 n=1 Tax=Protobothrops mucrosquamatus TaxID=103944 RepID=UPI0010FAF39B
HFLQVVKDNRDYYANLHAAFYREEDACRRLLENKDAVDWDKAFQLQGLQDGLYHAVKVMAEARRVHMEPYFYQVALHPDAATFCQNQLRSEPLHLGTLSPSHAALLNDTWAFASNDRSLRYLRSLTENFPNACLLDEESQPVAWCLSDAVGSMAHAYTLPKYRKKGHMKTATLNGSTQWQPMLAGSRGLNLTLNPSVRSRRQLRSEPLHLGTLSPSHAALLNDTWAFASNDRSLRYLRSLTENFPNACLLDEESQPVAWPMQLT